MGLQPVRFVALLALPLLLLPQGGGRGLSLEAQELPWPAARVDPSSDSSPLELTVRDTRTGRGVLGVRVEVEGGAPQETDGSGRVVIPWAPPGVVIALSRFGYLPLRERLGEERTLVLMLEPAPLGMERVEVRSRALGRGAALQPSAVVGAQELAERMAASVAATIAWEPGVTARTNGPMASQPVIRGLGGDRVLVLEDGLRTGDIATTAPDHAVTIEPATAREIEVIRGPGGLLYGSNTLGGVVNVVREDVPITRPDSPDWLLSTYAESVNRGISAAGRVKAGLGPLALQVDGSGRTAGDTRTPGGVLLPFTDVEGFDMGAGISLPWSGGHIGVAGREYSTFYGVPSSFDGVTLPGAHDGGVYIDAQRRSGRFDAEWRPAVEGVLEALSLGGNAVRFQQWEFEKGGFVGTRFGQLAASLEGAARLRAGRHRGAVGVSYQWRDLRAEGSFTGTRPAVHRTLAAFVVDEWVLGPVTLLGGIRGDRITTMPLDSTETLLLQDIRSREFTAFTGALGIQGEPAPGWTVGVQVARAFRPPSIEELYSAGPHLASYAYEVGRPDLASERGVGLDGVLRWQGARGRGEVAAYAMRVDGYITFAPQIDPDTGLPMRDPRLRRYVVYRPQQVDARLSGVELRATLVPAQQWVVDLAADLPRGSRVDGEALPSMPPGTGRLQVRHLAGPWTFAINGEGRLAQRRVPPPPPGGGATCRVVVDDGEATSLPADFCPTPGAVLLGAVVSYRLQAGRGVPWPTAFTVGGDNLLDTSWRDPLWRARLVAPQPGRNLRLAVQVTP